MDAESELKILREKVECFRDLLYKDRDMITEDYRHMHSVGGKVREWLHDRLTNATRVASAFDSILPPVNPPRENS